MVKAAAAAAAKAKALRQRNNENAARFFAAGMAGMMVMFIFFHWARFLFKRYQLRRGSSTSFLRVSVGISRRSRRLLLRKVPGFTSVGHALVFLGYLATSITVTFVNIDWSSLNNWAKRLGWIAASNIALVTFLSLKNTPLAFLAGYSYERLNILHQIIGYATVTYTLIHAVVYIQAWHQTHSLKQLTERNQVMGIVAGWAMLIILATALLLRKLRYEVFYIIHIVMYILILITVGMHRPLISTRTLVIIIFTASIWVADRILRFLKISLFGLGNTATITPLSHGGTRIVLRKSSRFAVPGSHCFLWIPGIRMAETHPFTVVSSSPLEFVIAARDGFTRDLHEFALKNPGRSLRASIDGPYGAAFHMTGVTKVLFIAGGSGASFSLGVAVDLVRKLGDSGSTTVEIIWVVKEQETIQWYANELEILNSTPIVTLRLHYTRHSSPSSLNTPILLPLPDTKRDSLPPNETALPVSATDSDEGDIEKHPEKASHFTPSISMSPGRPDIAAVIMETVDKADTHDRIAVAACGPDSLMEVTRKTVAQCIRPDGPSLELYCEQFGW